MDILDIKWLPSEKNRLYPTRWNIRNKQYISNKTLQYFLPDIVKVSITIDDIRLKSNLKISQTLIFTKNLFFYSLFGFTQSHSGTLSDFDVYIQLIAGTYRSDRPINITGVDKVRLKCIKGSIWNGVRQPILVSFALSSPPGHEIFKELRIRLFKKISKKDFYLIALFLEDDDYKPVDFNEEMVSFTCQLIKI